MGYPSGNFVATYHWIDEIGPKDPRHVQSRHGLAQKLTSLEQTGL
jgi:alpha-L-arabinofuranosidase